MFVWLSLTYTILLFNFREDDLLWDRERLNKDQNQREKNKNNNSPMIVNEVSNAFDADANSIVTSVGGTSTDSLSSHIQELFDEEETELVNDSHLNNRKEI